jgi:hypothetical protein
VPAESFLCWPEPHEAINLPSLPRSAWGAAGPVLRPGFIRRSHPGVSEPRKEVARGRRALRGEHEPLSRLFVLLVVHPATGTSTSP